MLGMRQAQGGRREDRARMTAARTDGDTKAGADILMVAVFCVDLFSGFFPPPKCRG